ncbi:thioredoxin family protein [Priestia aryabhattai]|uniref:thioredoxin family protein n=1 Tax=Priestia aryabhattai TaxID=412384 RepID=UPI002452FBA1|nr:thioredoxin family protein [Priestia aryabhattai]MDH3110938.1 thioredoxin family protein [Priestia aryabhattai]MDH3124511.1 thioredoxin family protein [Priestia aryabhattai]
MKKLEELTSMNMIEDYLKNHELSFLYVSREDCGVCHAVLPRLRELLDNFPLIHLGHINAYDVEEVAAKFSIFTVPVLLLFIDGKEVLREARFVHFDELEKRLEKIYKMYNQQ